MVMSARAASPDCSYVSSGKSNESRRSPVGSYVSSGEKASNLNSAQLSGANSKPPSNRKESPVGSYVSSGEKASNLNSAQLSGANSKPPSNRKESPVGSYVSSGEKASNLNSPQLSGANSKPPSNRKESPVGSYVSSGEKASNLNSAQLSGANSKPPSNRKESPVGSYVSSGKKASNLNSAQLSGANSKPPSNRKESPVGSYVSSGEKASNLNSAQLSDSSRKHPCNKNVESTPIGGNSSVVPGEPPIAGVSSIKRCPVEQSDINSLSAWIVPSSPPQGAADELHIHRELLNTPPAPVKLALYEKDNSPNGGNDPVFYRPFLRNSANGGSTYASFTNTSPYPLSHRDVEVLYESHKRQVKVCREAARAEEEIARRKRQEINAETARIVSEASRLSFSMGTHRKVYDEAMDRLREVRPGSALPKACRIKTPRRILFSSLVDSSGSYGYGPARRMETIKDFGPSIRNNYRGRTGGAQVALALLKSRFMAGWVAPNVVDRFSPHSPVAQTLSSKYFVEQQTNVDHPHPHKREVVPEKTDFGNTNNVNGSEDATVHVVSTAPTTFCDMATPHSSINVAKASENVTMPYCSSILPEPVRELPQSNDVLQNAVGEEDKNVVAELPPPAIPLHQQSVSQHQQLEHQHQPSLEDNQKQEESSLTPVRVPLPLPPPTRLSSVDVKMKSPQGVESHIYSQSSTSLQEVELSFENPRPPVVEPEALTEEDKRVLELLNNVRDLRLETEKLVVELLHSTDEWGCWCSRKGSLFRDLFILPDARTVAEVSKRAMRTRATHDTTAEEHPIDVRDNLIAARPLSQEKFAPRIPPPPPIDVLLKCVVDGEQQHVAETEVDAYGEWENNPEVECASSPSVLPDHLDEANTNLLRSSATRQPHLPDSQHSPSSSDTSGGGTDSSDYSCAEEEADGDEKSEENSSWSYDSSLSSAKAPPPPPSHEDEEKRRTEEVLQKETMTQEIEGPRPPNESVLLSDTMDPSPTPIHPVFHAEATGKRTGPKQKKEDKHEKKKKGVKGFFSRLMCCGGGSTSVADGKGGTTQKK
ncbi:hypothetical protein, conserved [Trypanosoma brucei gambiense DAL972]|uniref:Uncharacterized protein n=1 Tax=Trypanosoma brucei gambiense (strain MHOM/CI/86/DAL972) TaxID=679716 RepID=C9ZTJ1_TRYB9|nr:hypothetical protein, conserved [Trypanosoma brucei gambiense DAL972]CBH12726.1 hypothetical protein, conserved [Trypanosoma brucei gambiense DAL972]|eukprot:XP_011775006.1 hypothetical protein, conserved [Trypanosoma brucei gambiense DAL972]